MVIKSKTDMLIDRVKNWGEQKGLNNPQAQLNKCLEEFGEIAHEITRNNYDTPEMKDAIGDTMVTLIILSDILGLDPVECLDSAYNEIKGRKGKTIKGMFIKNV